MKPRVFIASSSESSDVARALQLELEDWAETTIWSQGVFTPSGTTLDDLIKAAGEYDFGIFVFSLEDIIKIRNEEYWTTRDNVVFELGLFIGKLGKERTFLVVPRTKEKFHLPTDLLGITYLPYEAHRRDGNLQAALGSASTQIGRTIKKLGNLSSVTKVREEESQNLLEIVRRIVELHQPAYADIQLSNWKVVHSIDLNGTGHLHETFTLTPKVEPLYFYLIENNYLEKEREPQIKITATKGEGGIPLSLLRLGHSQGTITHAIVLDPPASRERPQTVVIDCVRENLWKDLVTTGEDHGTLRVTNRIDSLHFEFVAPSGREWKGFTPKPLVGDVTISPSSITWDLTDPEPGRFSYRLFLK